MKLRQVGYVLRAKGGAVVREGCFAEGADPPHVLLFGGRCFVRWTLRPLRCEYREQSFLDLDRSGDGGSAPGGSSTSSEGAK